MIEMVKTYAIMLLVALLVTTSLATWQYRRMFKATDFALQQQNKAVKQLNETAARELAIAKAETKAAEDKLKAANAKRNEDDVKTMGEITVAGKRDTAPVVVRYITRYARSCDPRTEGGATANAGAGGADTQEASGVLAPKAAELTRRDRDAVEELQAAFNSCKSDVETRIAQ